MNRYKTLAISTSYWKPGEDYIIHILEAVGGKLEENDIVTVSEKALSTSIGNIIDENKVQPSRTARFLAKYWMRIAWGYLLGPACHLRKETIQRFRNYPPEEGAKHKQVALEHAGFLQALMPGSEGGIDGSNLPYAYVSLTLPNAPEIAQKIRSAINQVFGKNVSVLIIDTDKTYSWRGFHFTPRPQPMRGIRSFGGVLAYLFGRFLKLKQRATPLAVAGEPLDIEEMLNIAMIANRARGFGAGRTVWDMVERFGVSFTQTSWEMLARIDHKPIVIVRRV